jgi:hypothetical protein
MKKYRIKVLTWLSQKAKNHRTARQAVSALLFLEIAGISWYNPLWHLRNFTVLFTRSWSVMNREMRGYQKPIQHPNPKAIICRDFLCLKHSDQQCEKGNYTEHCLENCFGIRRMEDGKITSAWNDYNGNPDWLELGCRSCEFYMRSCKGINPKYLPAATLMVTDTNAS